MISTSLHPRALSGRVSSAPVTFLDFARTTPSAHSLHFTLTSAIACHCHDTPPMLLPVLKINIDRRVRFDGNTADNNAQPVQRVQSACAPPEYYDVRKDSRGRKVFVAHKAPCYGKGPSGKAGFQDVKKGEAGGANGNGKKETTKAGGDANGAGGAKGGSGDEEKVSYSRIHHFGMRHSTDRPCAIEVRRMDHRRGREAQSSEGRGRPLGRVEGHCYRDEQNRPGPQRALEGNQP